MDSKKSWLSRVFFSLACCYLLNNVVYADTLSCNPGATCKGTLNYHGQTRNFLFYLPNNFRPFWRNTPVIIVLHDSNTTADNFERLVLQGTFEIQANKYGGIIIYPEAINNQWSYSPDSPNAKVDDVGFLAAVLDYFNYIYFTSTSRVYIAGMGSGGMLAFRFACEQAPKVSSIATVLAAMPVSVARTCKPNVTVSVMMINARNDLYLPWNSNQMVDIIGQPGVPRLTIPQTYDFWVRLDHMHKPPVNSSLPMIKYDGTWVWLETARNLNTQINLFTLYGAGHNWPGVAQKTPNTTSGKTSFNLDAANAIWEFFMDTIR
jgi:poly(3-hydroxybutyrate) depolymerase